ncbi:MAG: hypothetical protein ACOYN6_14515 [Ignavibacteria bacterium]
MGILKNPMIGIPSGKVGEFIIRHRYGKEVIYSKPKKYKTTKSVPLKNARKTFKIAVELAKVIKRSSVLNDVWKFAKMPGKNSYTKILKANIKMSDPNMLTTSNDITPGMDVLNYRSLALESFKAAFKPKGLQIEYSIYKHPKYKLSDYPLYMETVIFAYNPVNDSAKKKYVLVSAEERIIDIIQSKPVKHLLANKTIQRDTLNEFSDAIIYFAIVTANLPDLPPLWSWTSTCKLGIPVTKA